MKGKQSTLIRLTGHSNRPLGVFHLSPGNGHSRCALFEICPCVFDRTRRRCRPSCCQRRPGARRRADMVMMNKDQRRGSPPGAERPPPSRRGRPAIPGRAIAPTASLPQGSPLCSPKPPGTVSFRSRRPGLSFPSPTWPRSGRWQRAPPAGWFSGRTGTRADEPQGGFEGGRGNSQPGGRRETAAGLPRVRGGGARRSHPEARLPSTNKTPDQTKTQRASKGMMGKGWRPGNLARFYDKIAPALGATEAELGQARPSERGASF